MTKSRNMSDERWNYGCPFLDMAKRIHARAYWNGRTDIEVEQSFGLSLVDTYINLFDNDLDEFNKMLTEAVKISNEQKLIDYLSAYLSKRWSHIEEKDNTYIRRLDIELNWRCYELSKWLAKKTKKSRYKFLMPGVDLFYIDENGLKVSLDTLEPHEFILTESRLKGLKEPIPIYATIQYNLSLKQKPAEEKPLILYRVSPFDHKKVELTANELALFKNHSSVVTSAYFFIQGVDGYTNNSAKVLEELQSTTKLYRVKFVFDYTKRIELLKCYLKTIKDGSQLLDRFIHEDKATHNLLIEDLGSNEFDEEIKRLFPMDKIEFDNNKEFFRIQTLLYLRSYILMRQEKPEYKSGFGYLAHKVNCSKYVGGQSKQIKLRAAELLYTYLATQAGSLATWKTYFDACLKNYETEKLPDWMKVESSNELAEIIYALTPGVFGVCDGDLNRLVGAMMEYDDSIRKNEASRMSGLTPVAAKLS